MGRVGGDPGAQYTRILFTYDAVLRKSVPAGACLMTGFGQFMRVLLRGAEVCTVNLRAGLSELGIGAWLGDHQSADVGWGGRAFDGGSRGVVGSGACDTGGVDGAYGVGAGCADLESSVEAGGSGEVTVVERLPASGLCPGPEFVVGGAGSFGLTELDCAFAGLYGEGGGSMTAGGPVWA